MQFIKDKLKDLIMRIPICVFGNLLTAAARNKLAAGSLRK